MRFIRRHIFKIFCITAFSIIAAVYYSANVIHLHKQISSSKTTSKIDENYTILDTLSLEISHDLLKLKNQFTQPSNPDHKHIRTINVIIPKSSLDKLESNLPKSGSEYVSGFLAINESPEKNKKQNIQIKYRGNNIRNWGFYKRSMRIKVENDELFEGMRLFNISTPRTKALIENHLSYELAKMYGVMTPKSEILFVNINNEKNGIYHMEEDLSELTLISNDKIIGDIYSPNMPSNISGNNNKEVTLFDHIKYWKKSSYNNHYSKESSQPLNHLLKILKIKNKDERLNKLIDIIDTDAFAKFFAVQILIGSSQYSDKKNWQLYYDQGREVFIPILWDARGWRGKDLERLNEQGPIFIFKSVLHKTLLDSDHFKNLVNKYLNNFFEQKLDALFLKKVDLLTKRLTPVVSHDHNIIIDDKIITKNEVLFSMEKLKSDIVTVFSHARNFRLPHNATSSADTTEDVVEIWEGIKTISGLNKISTKVVIKPGTKILLKPGATIVFTNKLIAQGDDKNPIQFIPANNSQRSWGSIVIKGKAANGSIFDHSIFRGGSGLKGDLYEYSGMLSFIDVKDIEVSNSSFSNNNIFDDMVYGLYSSINFTNTTFYNSESDLLDLELSNSTIKNCSFTKSGDDAIDLERSNVAIFDTIIKQSNGKGISAGQNSRTLVINSILTENKTALISKDGSAVTLINVNIENNAKILDAYHKNWFYENGGQIFIYKSIIADNKKAISIDTNSSLFISDSYLDAKIKKIKRVKVDELSIATLDKKSRKKAKSNLLSRETSEIILMNELNHFSLDKISSSRRGSSL